MQQSLPTPHPQTSSLRRGKPPRLCHQARSPDGIHSPCSLEQAQKGTFLSTTQGEPKTPPSLPISHEISVHRAAPAPQESGAPARAVPTPCAWSRWEQTTWPQRWLVEEGLV